MAKRRLYTISETNLARFDNRRWSTEVVYEVPCWEDKTVPLAIQRCAYLTQSWAKTKGNKTSLAIYSLSSDHFLSAIGPLLDTNVFKTHFKPDSICCRHWNSVIDLDKWTSSHMMGHEDNKNTEPCYVSHNINQSSYLLQGTSTMIILLTSFPVFQMYSGSWESVGDTRGPGLERECWGDEESPKHHLGAQGIQLILILS